MRTVMALSLVVVGAIVAMVGPSAPVNGQFIYRLPSSCDVTYSAGQEALIRTSASGSTSSAITICLNSGTYGTVNLSSITRTAYVTIQSVSGVGAILPTVSIDNSRFIRLKNLQLQNQDVDCPRDLQYVGVTWTPNQPGIRLNGDTCGSPVANVLIDGNTFDRVEQKVFDGRLSLYAVNTIQVTNSVFSGNPTDGTVASDGIMTGGSTRNLTIGPGNYFSGIYQDAASGPHVDVLQCYNGEGGTGQFSWEIYDNYFYDSTVFIGFYGGNCGGLNIHDNVFDTGGTHDGGSNCQAIQMGGLTNVHFNHNTFKNFACSTGIGTNAGYPAQAQWIVENNIFDGENTDFAYGGAVPGCGSGCLFRYNLRSNGADTDLDSGNNVIGNAVYTGSLSFANWANWLLTAASPGKAAGNDGGDMGTRYYGS